MNGGRRGWVRGGDTNADLFFIHTVNGKFRAFRSRPQGLAGVLHPTGRRVVRQLKSFFVGPRDADFSANIASGSGFELVAAFVPV